MSSQELLRRLESFRVEFLSKVSRMLLTMEVLRVSPEGWLRDVALKVGKIDFALSFCVCNPTFDGLSRWQEVPFLRQGPDSHHIRCGLLESPPAEVLVGTEILIVSCHSMTTALHLVLAVLLQHIFTIKFISKIRKLPYFVFNLPRGDSIYFPFFNSCPFPEKKSFW